MGLLDFFRKKSASIPLLNIFSHSPYFSTSNKANSEYYKGWVYACIKAIAEEVATIDLQLFNTDSKGKKERVPEHEVLTLIKKVNPFIDQYTLFERLQSNLELFGNEYWFLEKKGKTPVEIYPLNPTLIKPIADKKDYVKGYRYMVDGKNIDIPREDIIHFKNFNPSSDIVGMATLDAVKFSADTDIAAREYNKMYFQNSATPGVVLEYPETLTPEQVQRIKESWEEDHGGAKKQFKTAIAHSGMKINPLQTSQRDMEFTEQRKFSRDEILGIFRVPKTIIGIMEEVNFASAKTANYVFALRTIFPKMKRIVNTLNEFLLPLYGNEGLEFEFKNPIPEDKQQLVLEYQAGIAGGWLSINDVRRKEDLPPIENGEVVFTSFSQVPYGKPIEESKAYISSDPVEKLAKNITEVLAKEFAKNQKEIPAEETVNPMSDEMEAKGLNRKKVRDSRGEKFEKLFIKKLDDLWEDQKKKAKASLKEELNSKTWKKNVKAKKLNLLDEDEEVKATIDLFTPLMTGLVEEEGEAAFDFLGIDDPFVLSTFPGLKKFIKNNTKKFAGSITEETSKQLRNSIIEGLEVGEAIVDLTKRIDEIAGFGKARAEKIARTETIRGQSKSELEVWKETGVVTEVVWYTALDERVDDECAALHGKKIEIDENFFDLGDTLENGQVVDYESVEGPPLHPNCRCALIPIVDKKAIKADSRIFNIYQKLNGE